MATVAASKPTGKGPRAPGEAWATRESIRQTLADARRVASKAAGWLPDAELSATAEGEAIVIHVCDHAARCDYTLEVPVGLSRTNIARRLHCEMHSVRVAAGCEPWQLCLPQWHLLV